MASILNQSEEATMLYMTFSQKLIDQAALLLNQIASEYTVDDVIAFNAIVRGQPWTGPAPKMIINVLYKQGIEQLASGLHQVLERIFEKANEASVLIGEEGLPVSERKRFIDTVLMLIASIAANREGNPITEGPKRNAGTDNNPVAGS